jgi:KaiC/GvpD/RAD55 family RecA-like ATPase
MVDRIPTYIDGFDEHLEGGIPEGSILLLAGSTGTMKTSVAYSILHHNAIKGKKGLYISLEQNEKSILRQMERMGFDTAKAMEKMIIFDVGSMMIGDHDAAENWVASVIKTIQQVKDSEGCDLLVLDSLNAYVLLGGPEFDRTTLFKFFEWIRKIKMTAIVLVETLDLFTFGPLSRLVEQNSGGQGEFFLADGVIALKMHEINEVDVQRRIRILKLRGTNHSTSFFLLNFKDGRFEATWALE